MTLLEVKNLRKTYWKTNQILKWINFSMDEWEVLWYIGPNGAWKTTTIKLLLWINKPDAWSTILINGKDVDTVKNDNIISYLPEKLNIYWYMTGREYLEKIIIWLDNIEDNKINEKIEKYIKLTKFPIESFDKKISTYSKWMQQKIWLIGVLINDNNKLIILDEPVSGLDPIAQDDMINLLKNIKSEGKSIFITTHHMNEVELLCDNVCFVKNGVIKNKESVKEILKNYWSIIEYYKKFQDM